MLETLKTFVASVQSKQLINVIEPLQVFFLFRVNRCFNCIAEARQGPTNDISMRDFDENKSKLFYSFLKPGNGFEDAENQTQIFRSARPPTMLPVWQ